MVWNYRNTDWSLRKKCYCVIYCNFRHARSLWRNLYDCERPVINCGSHLPLALWPWQTWRVLGGPSRRALFTGDEIHVTNPRLNSVRHDSSLCRDAQVYTCKRVHDNASCTRLRNCRFSDSRTNDIYTFILWHWHTFVPYLRLEIFVTVIALKYSLLVSHWSYGHFLKLTHHANSYAQNGDRVATKVSASIHRMCSPFSSTRLFVRFAAQ